jgi:ElaB/YqjD/DUF883 family membrane-anchored ribosome-binding protein
MQNPTTTKDAVKNTASNIGSSVKSSMNGSSLNPAKSSGQDAAYSLTDVASDIAHQGYDMVAERTRMATEMAEKAYEGGVEYVKRHPARALIGAAAVGFVLAGFLLRRK